MLSLIDSKNIIKNEYGKNLSALMVVDIQEDIQKYIDFFTDLFKNIFICEDYSSGEYFWQHSNKNYDLIIVHINKDIILANELINQIREENDFIHILVFSTDSESSIYHASEHCFYADATLPHPFDEQYSYKFLYRFLKRISDLKDTENYINVLEDSLCPMDKESLSIKLSPTAITNIRTRYPEKISASDFLKTLDMTIVDKIELFQEDLDNYTIALYDMDECDTEKSVEKLQVVISILNEFSFLVKSMLVFPLVEDTFESIVDYLTSLDETSLNDKDKKKILIESLLGVGKDLDIWIKTIFINLDTYDIHYFDASFAESFVEIEKLFSSDSLDVDDESELEFF